MRRRFFGRKRVAASEILEQAVGRQTADRVTVGELLSALHERGFGLLMMVFVLPNCVPIPVPPGVSTVVSIPLIFLAVQMLIGLESPWLPKWLQKKSINRLTLAKVISVASPKLKKIELFLKPRLSFASSTTGERIIGLFWLIFAISIAVPLPMTNFIPGVGTLVMSLGLLSKDGATIIIGILIGLAGVTLTIMVLYLGVEAVLALFPFFSSVSNP